MSIKNVSILANIFNNSNFNEKIVVVKAMNYGDKLKEIRTAELWSQSQVAESLGIKRSTYKEYELQYSLIPSNHLYDFCNLFNVSIDYILGFTNIKEYKKINNKIDKVKSGQRLKEFRKENKLTQAKLADKIDVSRTIISEYEKGKYVISTANLYTICKKYKISADYLLGRIDDKIILNEDVK